MRIVPHLQYTRFAVTVVERGVIMGRRKATTTASSPSSAAEDQAKKYTFFWKIQSPFSQWYPAKFVADGVEYSCAEQYMMHQKAVLFHDEEMAKKILKTDKPKAMKAFGRKVKNFDVGLWNARCRDIVKKGNMAKFAQNSELKAKLFATKPTVMVEASPRDRVWGIGLSASNPKARRKETWRGKNWLGYALTEVRDELMAGGRATTSGGGETLSEKRSAPKQDEIETAQKQGGPENVETAKVLKQ